MLGISTILFLDLKGRVLITRHYRGNLSSNVYDKYNLKILEFDENSIKPIIQDEEIFYFHRRHNNIFIVAICENNVNTVMIFSFIGLY